MIARIMALRGSEPVRLVLYPVLVTLVGYAVVRGVFDGSVATGLLAVAALALGVPAVEADRAQVIPTAKVAGAVADTAVTAVRDAANQLHLAPEHQRVVDALTAQVQTYAGRHRVPTSGRDL